MGIGVVILVYGFAYLVVVALLSLVAWPIRALLGRRPKLASALRIAPFIIPGILPIAGLGALVWINIAPPQYVYRSVFDRPPDSSINSLHGQSSGSNDYREVFDDLRSGPMDRLIC